MYECPNDCGSREFVQTVEQVEIVELDDNGNPLRFDPVGDGIVTEVTCAECDAEVVG